MAIWVYILRCADDSYYTGHTDNLDARIGQHDGGAIPSCYTFKRRPVVLAFSQEFATRAEALGCERQIKGWNRKKKEAMDARRMGRGFATRAFDEHGRTHAAIVHPSTGSGRTGGFPGSGRTERCQDSG